MTEWILWYAATLDRALEDSLSSLTSILNKSVFWQRACGIPLSRRQISTLNLFLDGYEAKISSKTWSALSKCSPDTAVRDLRDLVDKNLLRQDLPGAKRPSYSIVYTSADSNPAFSSCFSDVKVTEQGGTWHIKALFKGCQPVHERMLKLDADRYRKGELTTEALLEKYFSYLLVPSLLVPSTCTRSL